MLSLPTRWLPLSTPSSVTLFLSPYVSLPDFLLPSIPPSSSPSSPSFSFSSSVLDDTGKLKSLFFLGTIQPGIYYISSDKWRSLFECKSRTVYEDPNVYMVLCNMYKVLVLTWTSSVTGYKTEPGAFDETSFRFSFVTSSFFFYDFQGPLKGRWGVRRFQCISISTWEVNRQKRKRRGKGEGGECMYDYIKYQTWSYRNSETQK